MYLGTRLYAPGNFTFRDAAGGWEVLFDDGTTFKHRDTEYDIDVDDLILSLDDNTYKACDRFNVDFEAETWKTVFTQDDAIDYSYIRVYVDTTASHYTFDVNLSCQVHLNPDKDPNLTTIVRPLLKNARSGIYELDLLPVAKRLGVDLTSTNWAVVAKFDRAHDVVKQISLVSGHHGGYHATVSLEYDETANVIKLIGRDDVVLSECHLNEISLEALGLSHDSSIKGSGKADDPLGVDLVTIDTIEGKGTTESPLIAHVNTDSTIEGDGTEAAPLHVNNIIGESIIGKGTKTFPYEINVQHDATLSGYGTKSEPLSIRIHHDETITGDGTAKNPLGLKLDEEVPSANDIFAHTRNRGIAHRKLHHIIGIDQNSTLISAFLNDEWTGDFYFTKRSTENKSFCDVCVRPGIIRCEDCPIYKSNVYAGVEMSYRDAETDDMKAIRIVNLDLKDQVDGETIVFNEGKLSIPNDLVWEGED
jgi:hypothetical protein